jgi:hypothetical protein
VAHLQVEDTAAISLWLRQCALPKELVAHEVYEGGAEAPLLHVDEHAARRAADAANALNAVEEALGPVLLPGLVTAVRELQRPAYLWNLAHFCLPVEEPHLLAPPSHMDHAEHLHLVRLGKT